MEDIFKIQRNDLKNMVRKYNGIFSDYRSYFDTENETNVPYVDLGEIHDDFKDHYGDLRLDFYKNDSNELVFLPYELVDIFCLMTHMMVDTDNVLSKSAKGANFVDYNEKVIKGIERLPEPMRDYIKTQLGYKYNYYLAKYIPVILERFGVLFRAILESSTIKSNIIDDFFTGMIEELDNIISDVLEYNVRESKYEQKIRHSIHFDQLLINIFEKFEKTADKRSDETQTEEKQDKIKSLNKIVKNFNKKGKSSYDISSELAELDIVSKTDWTILLNAIYNHEYETRLKNHPTKAEELKKTLRDLYLIAVLHDAENDAVIDPKKYDEIDVQIVAKKRLLDAKPMLPYIYKSIIEIESTDSEYITKGLKPIEHEKDIIELARHSYDKLLGLIKYELHLLTVIKLIEKIFTSEIEAEKYRPLAESYFDELIELNDSLANLREINAGNFALFKQLAEENTNDGELEFYTVIA